MSNENEVNNVIIQGININNSEIINELQDENKIEFIDVARLKQQNNDFESNVAFNKTFGNMEKNQNLNQIFGSTNQNQGFIQTAEFSYLKNSQNLDEAFGKMKKSQDFITKEIVDHNLYKTATFPTLIPVNKQKLKPKSQIKTRVSKKKVYNIDEMIQRQEKIQNDIVKKYQELKNLAKKYPHQNPAFLKAKKEEEENLKKRQENLKNNKKQYKSWVKNNQFSNKNNTNNINLKKGKQKVK